MPPVLSPPSPATGIGKGADTNDNEMEIMMAKDGWKNDAVEKSARVLLYLCSDG
jgi:hypothetical protein